MDLASVVADSADERPFHALGNVRFVTHGCDPFDHMVDLFLCDIFFHQNNHGSPRIKKWPW
jgi:hypothetical protein